MGADHPTTLTAMANLALVLHTQGELAKTLLLEEQVLEARRRLLGPKHPDTTLAEWNLLNTRRDLGDEAGARELETSLGWLLDGDESKVPWISARSGRISRRCWRSGRAEAQPESRRRTGSAFVTISRVRAP